MRALLYRALILLTVIGLVFTPPVLTGYANLRQADAANKALDWMRAIDKYEQAAILLPWHPELWEQAGIMQVSVRNFDEAIRLLDIAKERGALSDRGWEMLGVSYYQTGRLLKAIETWTNGLKNFPSNDGYYYYLAFAYREQGDLSAETHALEMCCRPVDATFAWNYYRLGLLLSISNSEQALEEFLLASSLDPEYDSAVETMRTTLNLASLETDESRRLVIIGRGLGLVGEWSLAAEAYRQAVAADGENAEAWAWLGEAEQQLGQDGSAELDKALTLDPENPIVHSLSGLYWMRQGDGERALEEYQLAAESDPDNPNWQVSIGQAYALSGDLQAALGAFTRATEIAPTDAAIWRALANFSAQYNLQVEDVGLPAAQMAVELTGEDPLALDTLGWTLVLLERYDEAQDVLQHAISIDPGLAAAHLHFGILSMQTDDWGTASEQLREARDLDPEGSAGEQAQLLLNQYFP